MAEVDTITVKVPDLGDFSDVDIVEVHVADGDEVAESDPLITLESEKSSIDVPAPQAGKVTAVLVAVGGSASTGTAIVDLAPTAGAALSGQVDERPGPPAVPVSTPASQRPEPEPTAQAQAQAAASESRPITPTHRGRTPDGIYASPSARQRARELGIDVATVVAGGRDGRVTREDVEAAADAAGNRNQTGGTGGELGLRPWPEVDFGRYGEIERVPLSKIRKLSRDNLWRNWVRIPHVTQHDEADITELETFRKQLNSEQQDAKVTLVALLMKACVATLKAFPNVNASLDGDELVLKHFHHIGFAADTPNGLLVPVIRDVDSKGILALAAELTELSGKARTGNLTPTEMQGATFTISSLGGIGGTAFTPIINAPEVAILGAVRAQMRPVWDGQQFQPRLMLPLSLSYDHRVVDGAEAARFVVHLSAVLADMRRILL